MINDPNYEHVQARFNALSPTQKASVYRRMAALRSRCRVAREHYLSALDSMIDLETALHSPPEGCPPADRPEVFAEKMKDAKVATCLMGGSGIPRI